MNNAPVAVQPRKFWIGMPKYGPLWCQIQKFSARLGWAIAGSSTRSQTVRKYAPSATLQTGCQRASAPPSMNDARPM